MSVEVTRTVVRWALLSALVLGVLGMHHLAGPTHGHTPAAHSVATEHTHTTTDAPDHDTPTPGHDLMAHLCLVVLAVAVALGLLVLPLLRTPPAPHRRAPAGDTGPPPPTSTRLASLCVLRL